MSNAEISRRETIAGGAATVALAAIGMSCPAGAAAPLTVQDVLDRMKQHVGSPWFQGGVDRIIEGSADTEVHGIGTTMMATFDALKDAVKAGANFVITHEPTYWSHPDTLTFLKDDPLYKIKREYIREHNMVSFHFHDHWHGLRPVDGINKGMQLQLGWTNYMDADNQRIYNLPPTTLLALAQELHAKLNDRIMRVIGDPNLPIVNVAATWGKATQIPTIHLLNEPVDVVIVGYTHEWEAVEYVQDMISAGQKKSMILLGESRAEQAGMKYCAEWLKTFISDVPVEFIPVIEPYWNLQHANSDITSV